jgi:hypothetical protein
MVVAEVTIGVRAPPKHRSNTPLKAQKVKTARHRHL